MKQYKFLLSQTYLDLFGLLLVVVGDALLFIPHLIIVTPTLLTKCFQTTVWLQVTYFYSLHDLSVTRLAYKS